MFWHLYSETGLEEDGIYLTLDGRLGLLKEYEDFKVAFQVAKSLRRSKVLTVQFQNVPKTSKFLVGASLYFESPEAGLRSLFSGSVFREVKESLDASLQFLLALRDRLPGRIVPNFTEKEVVELEDLHLFKLKVNEGVTKKVKYSDGFCEAFFPEETETKSYMLYLTERSLVDMLTSRLYCVEYVDTFKEKAFSLWWPLAANPFLADVFKL